MRIIIVGAGSAGKNLATMTHEMGHDLIVIDRDPSALTEIASELDVMILVGQGSSPVTLERAKPEKCDLFVAVTSSDDVNLLSCHLARNAGAKFTIARINDIGYLHSSLLNTGKLGVDRPLAHNERCAREIFDVLSIPGCFEATHLFKGRVTALGFVLPEGSPLLGKPLAEFRDDEWFGKVRFIGFVRDDTLQIPLGDSVFRPGDDLYAVLPSAAVDEFMDWALAGKRPDIKKVIVAGGSRLGIALARLVERSSMECVLIDLDRERAEEASEQLSKTLVLHADAAHAPTLKEAGLGAKTVFVAVTSDQETNIVSCIQAKDLGAGFTVSRIDKPQYAPIVD
ncbi:MAG: NAD-binding protein, partial [Planctomycetota bacterium]